MHVHVNAERCEGNRLGFGFGFELELGIMLGVGVRDSVRLRVRFRNLPDAFRILPVMQTR